MEQTLTYNRKSLITSFEKATGITQSVKIDTILEAKQIINHLIHFHHENIIFQFLNLFGSVDSGDRRF